MIKKNVGARQPIERVGECPFLPQAEEVVTVDSMRRWRADRGPGFYVAALRYAQWLWLEEKPAQGLLQLNKAWAAALRGDEPELVRWPPPYRALVWMLRHAPEGRFLGNPVRHFQHLATRGPVGARAWRAWGCFHLAEALLGFERDERQLERESVRVPAAEMVAVGLDECGWPGEGRLFRTVLDEVVTGGG